MPPAKDKTISFRPKKFIFNKNLLSILYYFNIIILVLSGEIFFAKEKCKNKDKTGKNQCKKIKLPENSEPEEKKWQFGFGLDIPSILTLQGAYSINKKFKLNSYISPKFHQKISKTINEHTFASSNGLKIAIPQFKIDGNIYLGYNYGFNFLYFPWEKNNGFFVAAGLNFMRIEMTAKANTKFLVCDASISATCSKQSDSAETLSYISVDSAVVLQNGMLDLHIGKEILISENFNLIFQLGFGQVFWLKKKIDVDAKFLNSLYDNPKLESELEPYLNSEEEVVIKSLDKTISKNQIFIKYLPNLSVSLQL